VLPAGVRCAGTAVMLITATTQTARQAAAGRALALELR
jgi:hypothetical protein